MKKKILPFILVLLGICSINGQLIKSDFTAGLSVGDAIEKGVYNEATDPVVLNQWNLWNKDLTNVEATAPGASPKVIAPLVYDGYVGAEDDAIQLDKTTSGIRVSTFSLDEADGNAYPASDSPYYLAFTLNPSSAETTANDAARAGLIAFNGSANGTFIRGVFNIFKQTDAAFRISLSGIYGGANKALGVWYQFGAPNLFIIKFDAVNNAMWIWANPTTELLASTTENVGASKMRYDFETETRLSAIRSISIFQRNDVKAAIGGIRFARSWEGIVKNISTGFNDFPQENKSIIKEQYFTPAGVEVAVPVERNIYIKKTTYEDGAMKSDKIFYLKR